MGGEDAFFEVDGAAVRPTGRIQGPWAAGQGHGGPPAALLGRYLEAHPDAAERRIVRVHLELLRPVPVAPLRVGVDAEGGGRRVDRLIARLTDAAGRPVLVARAVRVAVQQGPSDEDVVHPDLPPPHPPQESPPPGRLGQRFGTAPDYFESMEFSIVSGSWHDRGATTAWLRPTVPLIAGEEWSPLQRVLVAADSGNGLSNVVEYARYIYVNADLDVTVHRDLVGEWVGLEARTHAGGDGRGFAASTVFDAYGVVGQASQALLVARRE